MYPRISCLLVLLLLTVSTSFVPLFSPAARADMQPKLAPFFKGYDGAFVMYNVRRGSYVRHNAARCKQRFPSCSTRKVLDGLIGLETRVISDPDQRFKWDGTRYRFQLHNQDHSLRTAFAASTNWYFEEVISRVGLPRVRKYFRDSKFGNMQVSADYLSTRLAVSAEEQIAFLQRLHHNQLPFSRRTMDTMKDVMLVRKTERGILRGKTGTGGHTKDRGPRRPASEMVATLGWFVGWVEHRGNVYIFATNISGGDNPTGIKARQISEKILESLKLL